MCICGNQQLCEEVKSSQLKINSKQINELVSLNHSYKANSKEKIAENIEHNVSWIKVLRKI